MKRRPTTLTEYFGLGIETQEELAARLDVSQPTISRAANYGQGSYDLLKRIADATGVPLESFAKAKAA